MLEKKWQNRSDESCVTKTHPQSIATKFSLQIGLTKGQIYTPYQMNLAVYLVKWKIWEIVHCHKLSSLCWSAVKLPSEGSHGTMLLYTARIVESFSWVVFIAAMFVQSSLKQLCLAFPHSPLVPFMSPCTDSSVWQVPGMGAHSWLAGICQSLGQNLCRGWLAWIPQAANFHLAGQLVNLN